MALDVLGYPPPATLGGIADCLGEAIFILAERPGGWRLEAANPACHDRLAGPGGSLTGRGLAGLLPHGAAAQLEAACAACLADGRRRVWDWAGAGGSDPWRAALVPLPPTPASARRVLGTLADPADLRREAERLAEARREAIGALAAELAHELSQPVNIIALWASRRPARPEPEERRAQAQGVILGQTRRLGRLLQDLRALAAAPRDMSPAGAWEAVWGAARRAAATLAGAALVLQGPAPGAPQRPGASPSSPGPMPGPMPVPLPGRDPAWGRPGALGDGEPLGTAPWPSGALRLAGLLRPGAGAAAASGADATGLLRQGWGLPLAGGPLCVAGGETAWQDATAAGRHPLSLSLLDHRPGNGA